MRKRFLLPFVFVCLILLSCCSIQEKYNKDDFSEIVIEQSDVYDVWAIAPDAKLTITGKGGECKIPLDDGGCLHIKFRGESMIVYSIEETDKIA